MPFEEAKTRKNSKRILDIHHFINENDALHSNQVLAISKGWSIGDTNSQITIVEKELGYTIKLNE